MKRKRTRGRGQLSINILLAACLRLAPDHHNLLYILIKFYS